VNLQAWITWLYPFVAGVISLFYATLATVIFEAPVGGEGWRKAVQHVHQFWFNFLGSAAGWLLGWTVLPKVVGCAPGPSKACELSAPDLLVMAVSFVGVAGLLPYTLGALLKVLSDIAKEIVKRVLDALVPAKGDGESKRDAKAD
jgi:hypothetical protein